MPHTVMQAAVKEIINNPINDEHLHSRMELMRQNKELLVQELANEPYCRFGDASGALYATIILKLDNFDEHINKSTINFSKLLFAE